MNKIFDLSWALLQCLHVSCWMLSGFITGTAGLYMYHMQKLWQQLIELTIHQLRLTPSFECTSYFIVWVVTSLNKMVPIAQCLQIILKKILNSKQFTVETADWWLAVSTVNCLYHGTRLVENEEIKAQYMLMPRWYLVARPIFFA